MMYEVVQGAKVSSRGNDGHTSRARGTANLLEERCVFYLLNLTRQLEFGVSPWWRSKGSE